MRCGDDDDAADAAAAAADDDDDEPRIEERDYALESYRHSQA